MKKTRFGNGVLYFVDNIDQNSRYRGSTTGLNRTQIQRLDPTTVLTTGRTIIEEEKFLNTNDHETEDETEDETKDVQEAPVKFRKLPKKNTKKKHKEGVNSSAMDK